MNIKIIIGFFAVLCFQINAQSNSFSLGLEMGGNYSNKNYKLPPYQVNNTSPAEEHSYASYDLVLGSNLNFFIYDNLTVGLNLAWSRNDEPSLEGMKNSHYYTYSPSIRFYPYKSFYIQGQYDFGLVRNKLSYYDPSIPSSSGYRSLMRYLFNDTAKGHTSGCTFSCGYTFVLNHRFCLDMGLNYNFKNTASEYMQPELPTDSERMVLSYKNKNHIVYGTIGLKYMIKKRKSN